MRLTKKQTNELEKFGYTPKPKGAMLDLYWDDFSKAKEWDIICDCLGLDTDVEKITIAYVGVIGGKIEENK